MSTRTLAVYGAGAFGATVARLCEQSGYSVIGHIDDDLSDASVLCTGARMAEVLPTGCAVALAVGYRHIHARRRLGERVIGSGFSLPAIIHPQANVDPSTIIEAGTLVMRGACVDGASVVGALSVLWPSSTVSHDCRLDGNLFLSPGAVLCGFVQVGAACFVGAGTVVADHTVVPAGTFLRAGRVYHARSQFEEIRGG